MIGSSVNAAASLPAVSCTAVFDVPATGDVARYEIVSRCPAVTTDASNTSTLVKSVLTETIGTPTPSTLTSNNEVVG